MKIAFGHFWSASLITRYMLKVNSLSSDLMPFAKTHSFSIRRHFLSSAKVLSSKFIILINLGSEAHGGKNELQKKILFKVLESRRGKLTIYTSNLKDEDLPFVAGEHVSSRLNFNTKIIDLFTEDYRKNYHIQ